MDSLKEQKRKEKKKEENYADLQHGLENSIAWLINSMEPAIGKPFLFFLTAKCSTVRDQLWLGKKKSL